MDSPIYFCDGTNHSVKRYEPCDPISAGPGKLGVIVGRGVCACGAIRAMYETSGQRFITPWQTYPAAPLPEWDQ